MNTIHEQWMRRCFELAAKGRCHVHPNPMVGAVIVYNNKIIGEGYHQKYGEAHAEINALASVTPSDKHLLKQATIYVNLEPCNHQGKTGACTKALREAGIAHVVIANTDPNKTVQGSGIAQLKQDNIQVTTGILPEEGQFLNRHFFTFHRDKRTYILMKWAQSEDYFMGQKGHRIQISNALSQIQNHQWRVSHGAIFVGTQTAITDNPVLTTRHFPGRSPLRLVLDLKGRIPKEKHLLSDDEKSIVYTYKEYVPSLADHKEMVHVDPKKELIPQILEDLYRRGIHSLIVEGGKQLLSTFIQGGHWDEARLITARGKSLGNGIKSPHLTGHLLGKRELDNDIIDYVFPHNPLKAPLKGELPGYMID